MKTKKKPGPRVLAYRDGYKIGYLNGFIMGTQVMGFIWLMFYVWRYYR